MIIQRLIAETPELVDTLSEFSSGQVARLALYVFAALLMLGAAVLMWTQSTDPFVQECALALAGACVGAPAAVFLKGFVTARKKRGCVRHYCYRQVPLRAMI